MVEVNLKRTFSSGDWQKGVAIKDNVIGDEMVVYLEYSKNRTNFSTVEPTNPAVS